VEGGQVRVNYAIIFVRDMSRSVAFYRDVLELPLKFESPEWTEFDTDGATIALHASEEPSTHPGMEGQNAAGRCRPGFCVPDLDALHKKLLENGVACVQEPKEAFGVRIAQYLDPDGLAISVSDERGKR